ncbi:hypothetical protein BU26DRAFT_507042 [Trematosphaeria pertusa]|uniref:Uncharacterized protein n=1 Tax=Trematosphaeria pertusa TaxID=390896 RepID=A0A6A6IAB0_9PLEO|nr:uncharacterized protein BU26DRAFT_507042 [Trematosphaeria pertusa]KAF2246443.1 hypothetical protein BU26DRAFT_507042 [Trematosphaeria pertusa]
MSQSSIEGLTADSTSTPIPATVGLSFKLLTGAIFGAIFDAINWRGTVAAQHTPLARSLNIGLLPDAASAVSHISREPHRGTRGHELMNAFSPSKSGFRDLIGQARPSESANESATWQTSSFPAYPPSASRVLQISQRATAGRPVFRTSRVSIFPAAVPSPAPTPIGGVALYVRQSPCRS